MKKALIVGINHYAHVGSLGGCVTDAREVDRVFSRNHDGTSNFHTKLVVSESDDSPLPKGKLKAYIRELFSDEVEVALFYFAGHGHVEASGGYLLASDSTDGDDGVTLGEVFSLANQSRAKNRVIILDSCHAGAAGDSAIAEDVAELKHGTTVLAASTKDQYAQEKAGRGVYSDLLVDALEGAAANLIGQVTPGGVYAHIDQSLSAWQQRPVFKTNVKSFVCLRTVEPPARIADLHSLTSWFPTATSVYPLDPSYEPNDEGRKADMPRFNPAHGEVFAALQRLNRIRLVVPDGVEHMWNAAMESTSCSLTSLGRHYWRLVKNEIL